jgi:hypothetical protein
VHIHSIRNGLQGFSAGQCPANGGRNHIPGLKAVYTGLQIVPGRLQLFNQFFAVFQGGLWVSELGELFKLIQFFRDARSIPALVG